MCGSDGVDWQFSFIFSKNDGPFRGKMHRTQFDLTKSKVGHVMVRQELPVAGLANRAGCLTPGLPPPSAKLRMTERGDNDCKILV